MQQPGTMQQPGMMQQPGTMQQPGMMQQYPVGPMTTDPNMMVDLGQMGGGWQNGPAAGNQAAGLGGVGTLGQAKPPAPPTEFEWMGMEMGPVSQATWKRTPALTGKFGGLVADVDVGGQAERAGIKRGDLVVAINGLPVPTAQALDNAIKAVKTQTGVLVEIERMNQRMFATLQ